MMMLGEFLLTISTAEITSPDWDHGIVGHAPNGPQAGVVIYNRYNLPGTSQHFLTTNANFEDGHLPHPPWILEGGAFWVHRSPGPGLVPITRWFIGLDHVWVIGQGHETSFERQLRDAGFTIEGPDGYIFDQAQSNTVPVYRYSHMSEKCFTAIDPAGPDGGVVYGPQETVRLNALVNVNGAASAYAHQQGFTNFEVNDGPC